MKTAARLFVSFKEGKIAYTVSGKGRTIFLLHGFLGSADSWQTFIPLLEKKYRLVCIDLPGHGQSDCYGYIHEMDLMARAVKAVADKMRLTKYVLVGHSMGGYAALAFAELFPENLRGLCLFHSTSYADSDQKKKERGKAIQAVKSNASIYIRASIKNLFNSKNAARLKEEIALAQQAAKKTPRRGVIAALEGMKERKSRDVILHFAGYPIMFIIGRYDAVLPMQSLLTQAAVPKQNNYLLLDNSGHMGFLEEPQACAKALKRFLKKCFEKYKK